MKKIFSWGMMLAAAFTLTNCAKEIEDPNQQPEKQGHPFEIVASTVDTKTVNEGMATKWDDNDAINLFHAVAGAQDYGTNDEFTIADVETGRFTGTLTEALEAGMSYDWYALYPYNSNIATPGDRTDGYTYIGHSKGLNQTGYNSMASLKEDICPLYGVAKAVPSSDTPSITMNHLTSVVAIEVTNTTEEPLTIEKASLTAEEDIVGSYFIDITKSPVVYKASGEGYVKNTAVVNVSEGTALGKGESAILYLAIKPFTAKAGTSLTLSVNDYAKEPKVLTSDVTFHAGKIKTLNFAYDTKTVTWDLSKNETSEATENKIAWTSDSAEMYCEKAESNINANNYYGGDDNNRKSTRFYTNSILTIAPKAGYKITSVVFTATTEGYADALRSSTWANASAEVNSSTVTVTPTNGTQPMTATIGGTCGFTSVVVYYADNDGGETPEPEPKTLVSIAVENPQTEYTVGDEFVKPTVKATYDDTSTATVTGATFSGNDLASEGTKEVTVSYTEGEVTVTTSYNITVSAPVVDDTDHSGTYAIVAYRNIDALYYYLTNVETTTSTKRLTAVAAGNALPEEGVTVNGDKLWKVAKSGSTYTVQSVASSEYVAWVSGNSAIMSDEGIVFNLEENEGTFHFVYTGSGKARYLSLNNQTGNDYFAMYEGTISDLYLIPATEGEEAVPELTGITVNATKTTFTVGDEFAFEGTVTANYSNGTTKDVTESADFSGYNKSQEGPQTITVTYEGKTATYDITVNPAQSGGKELEIFKESFGDNSGSARAWNDSYKEQSGISNVYSASTYVMTNLKQGKNNVGYVKSAINQSSTSTPAYFEVKNLNVGAYSNFKVSYYWKAGSIKATYYTKLYYSTDGGSTYQEVEKDSGTGATSFVEVRYTLPSDIKTSSLSLKVEFFTSNTQASIDEFVLSAAN